MIIQKQLYDSLKNIKNFEEFETFRNSLEISDNDISNGKLFSVRTLSKKEYDKFIMQETLNGSITANDANTWNSSSNISYKSLFLIVTQVNYGGDTSSYGKFNPNTNWDSLTGNVFNINSYIKNNDYILYNQIIPGGTSTQTLNKMTELLQDNKTNAFSLSIGCKILEIATATYNDMYRNWYAYCGYRDSIVHGTTISGSATATKTQTKLTYSWNSSLHFITPITYCTRNLNINLCFRPIFQYVDNNKSANIYR